MELRISDLKEEDTSWYFSDDTVDQLQISDLTKRAVKEVLKFDRLSHIQSRTIPVLLKGRDVLGAAKTGSGKTLAFLIPAIQLIYKANFTQKNGTGVIIISPTRQLATQIFDVCKSLLTFHSKTCGLIIGGNQRKFQANKLEKGVNIVVCTPGRLLDHMHNTRGFLYHNLLALVIDEADAILKIGFQEQMSQILAMLPSQRQTMLFSATQTKKVDDLARLSLKNPIYIGVDDLAPRTTVQKLQQGFVIVSLQLKFRLLYTFLKKYKSKKIMVFFSSCNAVKFHADLFNYVDLPVLSIHGRQKQQKRINTFYQFNNIQAGALLCTDVAARGLDIPKVDWIVQFDPPDDTKEYIHRVGRTCRGFNATGKALLILIEQQRGYLDFLLQAKVVLNQYEFPQEKLANVQDQLEKIVDSNKYLRNQAIEAYRSCLHAYATHSIKTVFEVSNLDLAKVAKNFGLAFPPRVDLNLSGKSRDHSRKTKERAKIGRQGQMLKRESLRERSRQDAGGSRQFWRG